MAVNEIITIIIMMIFFLSFNERLMMMMMFDRISVDADLGSCCLIWSHDKSASHAKMKHDYYCNHHQIYIINFLPGHNNVILRWPTLK
jgi:hypothetical protein